MTCELFFQTRAETPEGSKFVFLSKERVAWVSARREAGTWKAGRTVTNNLTRDLASLVRAAGIADAGLHDLRRACITDWARKLAAPMVKELAGHADIKTTLRYYVTIRQEDLADARTVTAEALRIRPTTNT